MEKIGKYITKYIKGKTPKELFEAKEEGMLPYVSPDFLRNKAQPEFYAVPNNKTVQVENGDVIVLWDGSNAGEVFIAKKGILSSTMVKLDFDETEIDKSYYSYSFQYLEYFLKAKTAGSGIPHADKGIINKLDFFKPSKPEQHAIAAVLSKVDEAIATVESSVKSAERLKKAVMQNLLTGRLKPNGEWRSADEFYTHEKFGKIPIGWMIEKGIKITEKITKGQSPKWQGFEYAEKGILFITSENVRDGYLDISEPKFLPLEFNNKIKNSQLCKGDILINIVGASIGRSCIFNGEAEIANTNQAVCVFRVDKRFYNKFFAYYFQIPQTVHRLLSNQVETARANLSLGDFRKLNFIFPEDIYEQTAIADKLDEYSKILQTKQTKIQTLQRLKKSLMQNLLTGKRRIDVEKIEELLAETTD
jgi:type I restriction enzyme S subunit